MTLSGPLKTVENFEISKDNLNGLVCQGPETFLTKVSSPM